MAGDGRRVGIDGALNVPSHPANLSDDITSLALPFAVQ